MLCLRWAQLGAKLSPKVPSCGMLELTWTSMCIKLESIWFALGPTSDFSPTDQLAPTPRQRNLGPSLGQPLYFQRFLALLGVRVKPSCPRWACIGPNFGARCPHRTKLRTLSTACIQTGPSCAVWDLSWDQVGPKLEPTGLSSVQVSGQGRPSLTPVGCWLGQVGPLLSSPSHSLGGGRFSSRSDSNIIRQSVAGPLHVLRNTFHLHNHHWLLNICGKGVAKP